MKHLKLKAQMMPATRRADGSVTLKFVTTEEIETDKFAEIDSCRQRNGWLIFSPNQFDLADVPKDDAKIEGERSPSKTLQLSLYKLFMLQNGNREDFTPFYKAQMAKFQSLVGDKIEEIEGKYGNVRN